MLVKFLPINGDTSRPEAPRSFQETRQVRALFLRVIERRDDRVMLCQAVLGDEGAERAAGTDFQKYLGASRQELADTRTEAHGLAELLNPVIRVDSLFRSNPGAGET